MSDSTSSNTKGGEDTQMLIWGISPELKAKFKAKCALMGITMREAIIRFMTQFAGKDGE